MSSEVETPAQGVSTSLDTNGGLSEGQRRMQSFLTNGYAVDIVLAVLAIEAIWLKSRGNKWADILPALLPAVLMMIALRAALTGMAWPFVSIPLALAFPVHLYDLRRRKMIGGAR